MRGLIRLSICSCIPNTGSTSARCLTSRQVSVITPTAGGRFMIKGLHRRGRHLLEMRSHAIRKSGAMGRAEHDEPANDDVEITDEMTEAGEEVILGEIGGLPVRGSFSASDLARSVFS